MTKSNNYRYSERSAARLETCDPRLQTLFKAAIHIMNITIVCGYRSPREQEDAFLRGASKLRWPDSKHNDYPAQAVDAIPYPTLYESRPHFYMLNGVLQTLAKQQGIKLRWGGDWDGDNEFTDQTFDDLAHWELIED